MPSKKGSKKAAKKVKNEEEQNDAILADSEHEMDDNADAGNEQVADEPMGDADNDANENANDADENVGDDADAVDAGDGGASAAAGGAGNEMDEDGDEDENEANDQNDGNEEENDENEDNDENDESGSGSNKSVAKRAKKRRGGGAGGRGRGRGKAKARDNRYRVYLFKILQQVHPKVGITKTAMDIMNSFIEDMFEKICTEAMKLCAYNKTSTIGAREIATATKLILPGELLKHALLEGEKAVQKFDKNSKALQARREKARGGKKGVFPGRKK